MDRTELAWAAGFWDGEGSAYLAGSDDRPTKQPQARVNQAGPDGMPRALVRFRAAVGFGRLQGPDLAEGREPLYRWVVSSRADVERTAEVLTPWLASVKRTQFAGVLGVGAPAGCNWTALSDLEKRAWGAGLWDGEGSISLLKHRSHAGHFVPELAVTQSSVAGVPEVLERIASLGPRGFMYGPFRQPPPWSPVCRWKLFQLEDIQRLIDLLRPWLGAVKVEQAERAFSVLAAQPKLARGNPEWGSHKTHCVNGHEYVTARIRPYRARSLTGMERRPSKQCLACVREHARGWRERRKAKSGG